MSKNLILTRQYREDIRDVAKGSCSGENKAALTRLMSDPATALSIISSPSASEDLGLTVYGAERVMEEVLGEIADPDVARTMMVDFISPDRLIELIEIGGDLPRVSSEIAPTEVVLQVLATIGSQPEDDWAVKFWAIKLMDREDYPLILASEVPFCDEEDEDVQVVTFEDRLLRALRNIHAGESNFRHVCAEVGLVTSDLIDLWGDLEPQYSSREMNSALMSLEIKRQEREQAETVLDRQREQAEDDADDLDL